MNEHPQRGQRPNEPVRHVLCRQLRAAPDSPGLARQMARRFLAAHVKDAEVVEEMLLATTELVTNAVKFSGDRRPIWIHFLVTSDRLAITVTDGGSDVPAEQILRSRPRALTEGGRGLDIVREVSDDLSVFRGSVTIVMAAKHLRS